MKKLLTVVCVLSVTSIFAQPKLSVFKNSPSIKADIEKVAADYFENFNNVKGEIIVETVSTIQFQSKVIPSGALDATITKYKSPNSYSWQSTLFKTEDFKEAVARYKQYFRQLDGATFTFYDKGRYKLSGIYDAPDEGRSFASTTLELQDPGNNLKLFKVEIGLNFAFPEWIVKILVYEKISDEDVRPTKFF
jgi:hypothetical protein